MNFAEQIVQKAKYRFRPRASTSAELAYLSSIGMPADALAFYQEFNPEFVAQIGKVRLLGVSNIATKNSEDIVPGCYAYPCGYVTFARTICGDAFCFDTKATNFPSTAPGVLIAHDLGSEDDKTTREEYQN